MSGGLKPSGSSGLGLKPSGSFSTGLKPSSGFATGFEGGGIAGGPATPGMRKGGGGGGIFGWLGSKLSLAGHDLAQIPGGTYHMVKAALPSMQEIEHPLRFNSKSAGQQWGEFLSHPVRSYQDTAHGKFGAEAAHAAQQAGGVVGSFKQSLEHPLRDPFQTALTLAPGLHGVGRAAEIAGRIDRTAPRTLSLGEAKVPLPPMSGNAAIRWGQRAYGHALQHALDTNSEGRLAAHAAKRIGGSLQETARYQARMRSVPAQLLQHAGRELQGSIGKHLPFTGATAAQAALRLTSENSLPDEAAAFHRAQAAAGVEPKANLNLANLYDQIHQSGMLKQDAQGNVAVDAARFPKLAAADAALARAQRDAEQIAHEHGLMTAEGQRARLDAPAQIRAGADFVNPTPARLGVESHVLEEARRQVAHIEQLHAKAVLKAMGTPSERSAVVQQGAGLEMPWEQSPVVQRLSGALSIARDRLQLLEHQAANRVEPTGFVGGEGARPGRGYVPYSPLEEKAGRNPISRMASSVTGKQKSPITSHEFTGEGLKQGAVPDNTTELVARHLQRLYRFVGTDEFRRKALETGSVTKRGPRDVLVRVPEEAAAQHFSLDVERELARKRVTLDELANLEGHKQALADHVRALVPGFNPEAALPKDQWRGALQEAQRHANGTEAPKGYRWVDRNVLGDLGNSFALSRGRIGRFGDAVNSAVTTATVYLKPGHFPQRLLTNAGTLLIQGGAAPLEIAKSVRLWRALSHEDRIRALGAAGQGGYESMPHEGEGFVGHTATKAALWWTKHVDAPFRFASLAYEARRAGYRTAPAFRRFLHILEQPDRFTKDEALRADAIAKEANRAGIAYDRMSDAERRTIGRMVWFYPWVRNASIYAGRAFLNHPFKGSLMAQIGEHERQRQQNILGALPSYEYGLTALGNNRVSDMQRLFPFSTAADVLQVPEHPKSIAGYANPAVGGALGFLGLNSFGSPSYQSPAATAFENVTSSIGPKQILDAYLARNKDQSRKMFPNASAESAFLRWLLGVEYPRTINPAAAHSAAAREASGR